MIPGAGAPPVVAAASWSRRGWLAAAAALVLAGAGVAAWGVSSTSVLAAGLALDHLKCFAWFEPAEPPPSPDAVAAGLHAAYGWRITVPPDAPAERLRLLGGRRCFSTGGAAAHILYLHGGRPLSLYMVPGSDRAEATLALAGYQAVVWSKNHVTYVVLGHEGGEDLSRVAAYLKAASSR
jgi:anti-sigma factor RsiW